MADQYFDVPEIGRNMQHFIAAAPAYAMLDPLVQKLIDEQAGLLQEWQAVYSDAEDSRSVLRTSQKDHRALSDEVRQALDYLFKRLDAERDSNTFELARFFPTGKMSDSGRSYADRAAALSRCIDGLKLYPQIPDQPNLLSRLLELQSRFDPKAQEASSRSTGKLLLSGEAAAVRMRIERKYRGAVKIMDGLLYRESREGELKSLFLHLQVPSRKSKSGETA